jgi:hypothetical protein
MADSTIYANDQPNLIGTHSKNQTARLRTVLQTRVLEQPPRGSTLLLLLL